MPDPESKVRIAPARPVPVQSGALKDYRIVEFLGEAPLGGVHLLEHVRTGEKRRLLILDPEAFGGKDLAPAFEAVKPKLCGVSHPLLVPVRDLGCEDGIYYVLSDHVPGPGGGPWTLAEECREQGALPARRAKEIIVQLCDALEALYGTAGLVHGCLTPASVYLDADGGLHVADFGLVQVADPNPLIATLTLALDPGDPATAQRFVRDPGRYLSPEQWNGMAPTPASDVYALGALTHQLLAGFLPSRSWPIAPMLGVSGRWNRLVGRCMARHPASRYRTAASVRSAAAPSPLRIAAGIAAVAVPLVAIGLGGAWLVSEVVDELERQAQEEARRQAEADRLIREAAARKPSGGNSNTWNPMAQQRRALQGDEEGPPSPQEQMMMDAMGVAPPPSRDTRSSASPPKSPFSEPVAPPGTTAEVGQKLRQQAYETYQRRLEEASEKYQRLRNENRSIYERGLESLAPVRRTNARAYTEQSRRLKEQRISSDESARERYSKDQAEARAAYDRKLEQIAGN